MLMTEQKPVPVIEALSIATQQHLAPLSDLAETDYLEIWMDKDLERFVVQATGYRMWDGSLRLNERDSDIRTHCGREIIKSSHGASKVAASHWLSLIPERKTAGYGRWQLAATDFTALVIQHVWPVDRIIFKDEIAELKYMLLVKRFHAQNRVMRIAAEFKSERDDTGTCCGPVPEMPADFLAHPDWPLAPHQQVALHCSLHQPAYAFFMDPGTMKTYASIARVCLEAHRKRHGSTLGIKLPQTLYRVLVVCPNQVRSNWVKEFEKFATVPGKVAVLRGDKPERVRQLINVGRNEADCAFGCAVIGFDSLNSTIEHIRRLPWDLVIIDESHYIKNHWTTRWGALKTLTDKGAVRQKMILTGTPIANTPVDLFAQWEFLGEGLSGFISFGHFKAFHGKYVQDASGGANKLVAIKNIPLLQERLARLSFMITKAEAGLNLPDKVYDEWEVQMSPKQAEFYKQLAEQLAIEIEGGDQVLTAEHILTKLLRLSQITSGFLKFDNDVDTDGTILKYGDTVNIEGPNPKLEAVKSMLLDPERDPKGKTIIWASHRRDLHNLIDLMKVLGIKAVSYFGDTSERDREAAVDAFNEDPDTRVFIANAACAGAGLNLLGYPPMDPERVDTYCDHEMFYSQGWSSLMRSQAEDRAHRKGTRTNVRITDIVVPGTIDEEIRVRVLEKQRTALQIQDVRQILRNVLGVIV